MRPPLASTFALLAGLGMATTSAASSPKAVDRKYMDLSVAPCTNFYDFANGAYNKAPIPADNAEFGVTAEVDERNYDLLKDILDSSAKAKAPEGSVAQRVGDFYAAGMDEAGIEKAGLTPVASLLGAIQAVSSPDELGPLIGRLQSQGIAVAFDFDILQDDRDSATMIAKVSQGGLGLPDRDYYFQTGDDSERIRTAYVAHIARVLELAGEPAASSKTQAAAIMAFEKKLAQACRTLVALREPAANYNKVDRHELAQMAPHLNWDGFLGSFAFPDSQAHLVVGQPEFFTAFDAMLNSEPLATWRLYLRWSVLDALSDYLGRAFVEESFNFGGRVLAGERELKPRWKRVLMAEDGAVGEDLGQLYVKHAFGPAARARVIEMVHFHVEALHRRLERASWMGLATKKEAYRKLAAIGIKVGYPDHWRDYTGLTISRRPYVLNVLASSAFEFRRQLAKLGKPVDRSEWQMTPQTNNAYYDSNMNEIVLPAGALQPPTFDVNALDCDNYGALASTIGHELTHGFDDEGRHYDAKGNLRDWWTEADARAFEERAERIAKLYDSFEVLPGLHINGHQTLGENIADTGGLRVSYDAYLLATRGRPEKSRDGFTPEQRFFIAFAQEWRTNIRPEFMRLIVGSDVHSPDRWRVLGPVKNFPEFRRAFNCAEPQDSWPAIW